MKKTSVYLSDDDRARLARLAQREGKSQAFILREALAMYDASLPDRHFELFDAFKDLDLPPLPAFKSAQEFQDWLDTEGLKGFGEDSLGELES